VAANRQSGRRRRDLREKVSDESRRERARRGEDAQLGDCRARARKSQKLEQDEVKERKRGRRTERELEEREERRQVLGRGRVGGAGVVVVAVRLVEQRPASILTPSAGAQEGCVRVLERVLGLERDAQDGLRDGVEAS